jgi:hypothetical protein
MHTAKGHTQDRVSRDGGGKAVRDQVSWQEDQAEEEGQEELLDEEAQRDRV